LVHVIQTQAQWPTPQKYRDEAKRLRLEAAFVASPEVSRQMLDIAGQYDRLAASIELLRKYPRGH
jgi:hypothetical protein